MEHTKHGKGSGALSYIPRLNTFRAFAAFSVVFIHYFSNIVPEYLKITPDGVQFFFTLSGFLITSTLLSDSCGRSVSSSIFRFYTRRVFRIFPAYYGTLLICMILGLYGARQCWPWAATYTVDIFISYGFGDAGYLGHFWTLAVEEQFYILLPISILLLPRRWFVTLALMSIGGALIYRGVEFPRNPMFGFNPAANLDKLSVGVLTAIAVESRGTDWVERHLRRLLPITIPSFVLCSCGLLLGDYLRRFAFSVPTVLTSLFFAWLIAKAVKDGPQGSSWGGSILPRIGAISYGIYLFHLPVEAAINYLEQGTPSVLLRVSGMVVTVALAWISYTFYEMPLIELGKSFLSLRFRAAPASR
jgi:peptidoglycan/LPS O-acetylase OafA/YrhL